MKQEQRKIIGYTDLERLAKIRFASAENYQQYNKLAAELSETPVTDLDYDTHINIIKKQFGDEFMAKSAGYEDEVIGNLVDEFVEEIELSDNPLEVSHNTTPPIVSAEARYIQTLRDISETLIIESIIK